VVAELTHCCFDGRRLTLLVGVVHMTWLFALDYSSIIAHW